MTTLYLPLDTVAPAPGGLIVSAVLARGDAAVERITLGERALAEMAAVEPVGEISDLRLLADSVFCRARITAPAAILKVSEGVYRGLALIVAHDGSVERVALVDRPDAFQKRASRNPAAPMPLNIKGVHSMSTISMREITEAIRRADPQHREHVADRLLTGYLARYGRAQTAAAIGDVLRKSAAPARSILVNHEEAALIERQERERAAHAERVRKRAGKPEDDYRRPLDQLGAVELFKASNLRPIRPGFALGVGGR
jgi:hypothetical protein